jgi:hypothetical protein
MQWRAAAVAAAVVEAVAAACLAAEAVLLAEATAAERVAAEGTVARLRCRDRPVVHPRRLDPLIDLARVQGTAIYPRPALGPALAPAPLQDLVQVSQRVPPQELGQGPVLVPAAWRARERCLRAVVRLAAI